MQPENINKSFAVKKRSPVEDVDIDTLLRGIISGNTSSLSKALTLIENENLHFTDKILSLLANLPKHSTSIRIAITGPPGAGKSSFIDQLGSQLRSENFKIAILAIDPSSELSKGSILGDKTRMEKLSGSDGVFIRPSANNLDQGGIRKSTYDSIRLCEAAGYDIIFLETVGVGQSELVAAQITDLFFLLLAPAGGDELQGIKKGIVEMADVIIVNKADGDLKSFATKTRKDYITALQMSSPTEKMLEKVEVFSVSSLENKGIDKIKALLSALKEDETFKQKKLEMRRIQEKDWFLSQSQDIILHHISKEEKIAKKIQKTMKAIQNGETKIYDGIKNFSDYINQNRNS